MVADETQTRGSTNALTVLWGRKALIGAMVAGATGLAALTLQVITPRYAAEALIALNTRIGAAETVLNTKPTIAGPPLATVLVGTEMDILNSRALATQVVEALALDRDPEFNPDLKPALLPALRDLWRRIVDAEPRDARTAAVDAVSKRLTVKNGTDSFALRVIFESEDARKAALIANAFADLYIRRGREAKFAEMQLATDWIGKQITDLRQQLAQDTGAAVAFRQRHKLSPLDTRDKSEVAAQQLISLNEELAGVERERAEAESALGQARKAVKSGGLASLPFVEQSPFLQEMRKEEAHLLGRVAELAVGYRDDSPSVQAVKGQLASLRAEIDREIGRQVEMLAHKAAQAKAREDALRARVRDVSTGAAANDETMAELELREREIQAKNIMLDSFLARFAELTNRSDIEAPDARLASRATPPTRPSFPKPLLFLAVAFTGSLGLATSLALLLDHFRAGFRSTRQIKAALGLTTLGILPDIGRRPGAPLPGDLLVDKPESTYAEAVRSAQLGLMNVRDRFGPGIVLVTSSLPNEGKTAFAVSLGRSLALAEKKVLLVDCDLRRPSVARHLDAYQAPGLSDYLNQEASLQEIVRHDSRTCLDFVAAGTPASDAQRLLDDPTLLAAFARWQEEYEVVLVDTPPTMVAFDAAVLAPAAAFAVYVVEWDRTPRRAVEAGIEHLGAFAIPIGGVALSKVDLDRQREYGDYVDFCFRNAEYYGE
ncbi:MAG: polysaccharide biosynthesis tyrosine autokinase [Magnetospirillum sp.]|nr:polysaccharide biosynthesis tyrosine autokinase [Magnetospirillum sp.]